MAHLKIVMTVLGLLASQKLAAYQMYDVENSDLVWLIGLVFMFNLFSIFLVGSWRSQPNLRRAQKTPGPSKWVGMKRA